MNKEFVVFTIGLICGFCLLWGFQDQLPAKIERVIVPVACRPDPKPPTAEVQWEPPHKTPKFSRS